MNLTLTGLLVLLIIAGICGAIGRAIGGGTGGGFLVSIAVGFIGALLGTFIAHQMHLPELFMITIDRRPFPPLAHRSSHPVPPLALTSNGCSRQRHPARLRNSANPAM